MILVVVLGVLQVLGAASPASAAGIAASAPATWRDGVSFTGVRPGAVACTSTTVCFEAGPGINATSDGGATWYPVNISQSVRLVGLTCPSTTDCFASGTDTTGGVTIMGTVDGGTTWSVLLNDTTLASQSPNLNSISCPTTTHCVAVGSVGSTPLASVTNDGGATWSAGSFSSNATGTGILESVSCLASGLCAAAVKGSLFMSGDGGTTWAVASSIPARASTGEIASVSCSGVSTCVAVGLFKDSSTGEITGGLSLVTNDGGASWTETDTAPALYGVSCPGSTTCSAVGSSTNYTTFTVTPAVLVTTDGAGTWTSQTVPTTVQTLSTLFCLSVSDCVAFGSDINGDAVAIGTTDGGATWAHQSVIPEIDYLQGISCATTTNCVLTGTAYSPSSTAIGPYSVSTTDGGTTWIASAMPPGVRSLASLTCQSASVCIAVGSLSTGYPAIVYTHDGGQTWSSASIPLIEDDGYSSGAVTCVSGVGCLAYGSYLSDTTGHNVILLSTDGGATWAQEPTPAPMTSIDSMSCWDQNDCVAVGTTETPTNSIQPYMATSTNGLQTWTADSLPASGFTPQAVACPGVAYCVAVGNGNESLVTTDGFSTSTAVSIPTGGANLGALSCPTNLYCTTLGTFSNSKVIFGSTDGGNSWTEEGTPTDVGTVNGISCPTTATCTVAGQGAWGGEILTEGSGGPIVTTTSLAPAYYATSYQQALTAEGHGPISWSAQGLPQGLQLVSDGPYSANLTGYPYVPLGTYDIVITAEDATGASTATQYELTIGPATPTLTVTTSAPGGTTYGTPVTYYFQLSGNTDSSPRGTFSVSEGTTLICYVTFTGAGDYNCQSSLAPGGNDIITAYFSGDAYDNGVSATTGLRVAPAPSETKVTSSPASLVAGQTVTYVATVTSSAATSGTHPIGSVDFYDGHQPIAACQNRALQATMQVGSIGQASCATPQAGGVHNISASYSGSEDFAASTGVGESVSCPTGINHTASGEPWAVASTAGSIGNSRCAGYWVVTRTGGVVAIGGAKWLGDVSRIPLHAPIVAIAATPDHNGYYLLGADGGIFSFGDARFYGSTGNAHLNAPMVTMAVDPQGTGYWLVGADGGIFSYGSARFQGSTGGIRLAQPVVGMTVDSKTGGYWMVAADGGIFAFKAPFYGSTAGVRLSQPVVGMSPQPDGRGYRLVAADGGVFDFGDATYFGSLPAKGVKNPQVTTMASSMDGKGYYLINSAGTVWAFGDAPFLGNA